MNTFVHVTHLWLDQLLPLPLPLEKGVTEGVAVGADGLRLVPGIGEHARLPRAALGRLLLQLVDGRLEDVLLDVLELLGELPVEVLEALPLRHSLVRQW